METQCHKKVISVRCSVCHHFDLREIEIEAFVCYVSALGLHPKAVSELPVPNVSFRMLRGKKKTLALGSYIENGTDQVEERPNCLTANSQTSLRTPRSDTENSK